MDGYSTPYYTRCMCPQIILVDAMMTASYPVWDTYVTNIDNPEEVVHPITNLVRFREKSTATHHTYVRFSSEVQPELSDGNKLKVKNLITL